MNKTTGLSMRRFSSLLRLQSVTGKPGFSLSSPRREKGQSFVELGLSLIFLIILLSAVIDLGWAFFSLIALRDSVQEAGTAATICPIDFAKIKTRLKQSASAPIDMDKIEDERIQIKVTSADGATIRCEYNLTTTPQKTTNCSTANLTTNDLVSIKVTYDHEIMTPLVGSFIGRQEYPLEATVVNQIVATDCRLQP